jgi:hypothetical protein
MAPLAYGFAPETPGDQIRNYAGVTIYIRETVVV